MGIYDANAPCPCGSGRKVGECCQVLSPDPSSAAGPRPNMAAELNEEIRRRLAGRRFSGSKEFQEFVDSIVDERNRRPLADFCGLSRREMEALYHHPFASPGLVHFAERIDPPPHAPILVLYEALARVCTGSGLKATVKGNLPRSLVREAARLYWRPELQDEVDCFLGSFNEERFHDLNVTRVILTTAGLLRKFRGRFQLTRRAKDLVARGIDALYRFLFFFYCERFNWAYWDFNEILPIIQDSFLFTMFMLSRFGEEYRPFSFYEEKFMAAFPHAVAECPATPYLSAEEKVHLIYQRRALLRFAWFFGLADVKSEPDAPWVYNGKIRKNPLLDRFVIFKKGLDDG